MEKAVYYINISHHLTQKNPTGVYHVTINHIHDKNETKYITEWYCKGKPDTMKKIILNSIKLTQVI